MKQTERNIGNILGQCVNQFSLGLSPNIDDKCAMSMVKYHENEAKTTSE